MDNNLDHLERANQETGTDDRQEVGGHAEADVESGSAMQEKRLGHGGKTSNDTFLKAISGHLVLPKALAYQGYA